MASFSDGLAKEKSSALSPPWRQPPALATTLGAGVERLARSEGSTIIATLFSRPQVISLPAPDINAIDFTTTGSIQKEAQHELAVLGPFGDQAHRR